MSKRVWVGLISMLLVSLVLVLSTSATMVWAQVTKTPGGMSGFTIPTSTPAANSSGGGLFIPTSTPDSVGLPPSSSGDVLPLLDADGLQALNIQPEDVPAAFVETQTITFYYIEDVAAQIEINAAELADQMRRLSTHYGWESSVGIGYAACDQSLPVSRIYSEVAQLASVDHARAFVDDPDLAKFYTEFGTQISPVTTVHGFYTTSPAPPGSCFANEISVSLNFDYWGLFISVSVNASSTTDPALITDMLDQLAELVVARVDALAGGTLQATPASGANLPTTQNSATATKVPFSLGGNTTNQQNSTGTTATLADIEAVIPTIDEIGLPTNLFAVNTDLSQTQTPEQVVAFWQTLGLNDIASAVREAMQQSGSLGQVVRVWDTGQDCPQTVGISVEIDVMLFQDETGPETFLNNQNYFDTLTLYGVYMEKTPDGGMTSSLFYTHACGDVQSYGRIIPHGRYLVSASVIAYIASDQQTVEQATEGLTQYTIQKLEQMP